jgi:predicted PurR-regulated permease PerM
LQREQLEGGSVVAAEAPTLRQLLHVVLGTVIVAALYLARDFLIPITLALLLAFVLAPLVRAFRRARVPHVASVFLAISLSVGSVVGVGTLIGSQVVSLGEELPLYQHTISAKFEQIGGLTTGKLAGVLTKFGLGAAQVSHQVVRATGLTAKPRALSTQTPAPVEIVPSPPTPMQMARQIFAPVFGPLATIGLVFVVAIFILLQQRDLRDRMIRLIGSSDLYRTTTAMDDAATRLSRYFLSQVGVNAAFGLAIGLGLYVIGVPHAVLWGAVSALLRFIPYLGALSSVALAAAMAAAVDPGWTLVAWTVALFIVVEAATGQVIEPLIYGRSTGLSSVSVVVAAIFWTWLWGPVGLFLSTPLSLCLLVIGRHVPQLEFIEVLLGSQPPLTAVEIFYQRILAGDVDDVLQQAELSLREGTLARYYDQVAIKGLLLATSDARRRVLRRDQFPQVRGAIESLIADLRDIPDARLAPEDGALEAVNSRSLGLHEAQALVASTRGSILCICGPGIMDDLASEMMAQMLARQGLVTRLATYQDASREAIDRLDVTDVAAICVTHLGVGRRPPRLDYLLGRIVQHAPGMAVVLAMPLSDGVQSSPATMSAPWAEVATLQDAVTKCFEATAHPSTHEVPTRKRPARRRTA